MSSEQLKNYYGILNLDFFESNQNTIRNSYRKLTEKFHPNNYTGEDLKDRLIEINEAFLVLSDSLTKKIYDSALSADANCDFATLNNQINEKRNKAEAFILSYFSGTQKKKASFWKIVGIILLVLFTIGTIGRIVATCSQQIRTNEPITSASTTLQRYTPPSDWTYYKIDDAFSLYIPPTLEIRSEYDRYTQFLSNHHLAISNADVVFQQKDLGEMSNKAFSTYCRVMAERYYVGADNVEHHFESPQLTTEDYAELRSIADAELGPWSYITTPKYEWISINGTKGIDISYSRQGTEGEVICHIYLFFNYDEFVKIITSYRKVDEQTWKRDIEDVVKTFKWVNPK